MDLSAKSNSGSHDGARPTEALTGGLRQVTQGSDDVLHQLGPLLLRAAGDVTFEDDAGIPQLGRTLGSVHFFSLAFSTCSRVSWTPLTMTVVFMQISLSS
jgi:hypothetical protein